MPVLLGATNHIKDIKQVGVGLAPKPPLLTQAPPPWPGQSQLSTSPGRMSRLAAAVAKNQ